MTSYQKRLDEIADLKKKVASLEKAATYRAVIFFKERQWLGHERILYGYIDEEGNSVITSTEREES
jgi:hypothetical protein